MSGPPRVAGEAVRRAGGPLQPARTAAAARDVSVIDGLLVEAQLRPWRSSIVMAAIAAVTCIAIAYGSPRPLRYLSVAAGLLIAASFACHVTRGARSATDRLAPVVPFVAAGWIVGLVVEHFPRVRPSYALGERTASAVVAAILIAWIVPYRQTVRSGGVRADVLLAVVAVLAVLADSQHNLRRWGTLAATTVAFECAVLCSIRAPIVIASAAALGIVHALFQLVRSDTMAHSDERWLLFSLALTLWPLGAVLARIARRGRSMSVIPLDHPVHADFGGRASGSSLRRPSRTQVVDWARRWAPPIVAVAIGLLAFGEIVRLLLLDAPYP